MALLDQASVSFPIGKILSFASRMGLIRPIPGFNTQYNGQRDLNTILGYDDVVTVDSLFYVYQRGGIAKKIVDIVPKAAWGKGFEVEESHNLKRKTAFEKDVNNLLSDARLGVLDKLLRASILSDIGHFSAILIGAPGNPEDPLPDSNSIDNIGFLWPLGENKITVSEIVGNNENDKYDERYGLPRYYQVNSSSTLNSSQNRGVSQIFSMKVHWSRIIHVVSEPLDNEIYSDPFVLSVWNLLCDLAKLTGGLSEAALRRGWPGLHANIDSDAKVDKPERDDMKQQMTDYQIGMLDSILTRKVSVNPLFAPGSIAIKENAEAIIAQIAGTRGVPMRKLLGSERGDLASSTDRSDFQDTFNEYRLIHCNLVLRQFFSRLYDFGYINKPKNINYKIIWPNEDNMSEMEKATTASTLSSSNVLTQEEIRDRIYNLAPIEPVNKVTPDETL